MSFPHFVHVQAPNSIMATQQDTKSVFVDNMPYDLFILTDLTRCAAILKFCEDPDNITETSSTDEIFDLYIKLSKQFDDGIMNFFLTNFEQILLMYIHARFGNLFNVIIERVKEPLVKFPVGCFVDKTNLIVIYSPPSLIEYIDRLSMSLLLYTSSNSFIRNNNSNEVFKSRAMKIFEDKIHKVLNTGGNVQQTYISDSLHSRAPQVVREFLNGIAPNYDDNMSQITCDTLAHTTIAKTVASTFAMSHYDHIAFSSARACYDDDNDDDNANGENYINNNSNDALFLTSNYLATKNMMLYFNRIFSEQNKSSLLFLSTIRTILSTAIRPIIDLFVLNADERQQEATNKRRRKQFTRLECTSKRNIQQKLINVEVDDSGSRSSIDSKFNHVNMNLRQKRLNIDVHIKQ